MDAQPSAAGRVRVCSHPKKREKTSHLRSTEKETLINAYKKIIADTPNLKKLDKFLINVNETLIILSHYINCRKCILIMEICRCNHYRSSLEKVKFNTFGTLPCDRTRLKLPENRCITWKRTLLSPRDYRFQRPVVVHTKRNPDENGDIKINKPVHTKWMPVTPGLASLRIVNKLKPPERPF
ncbi:hypothetical protein MML48_1g08769 [Holotrichia oblita]|uniref:Uncharacterized protein n=1 Tax=Holotrichia oblita TaxID=644536 RepID=A0ACB9TV51_HOLOL|nr:hypothetical protein MML48_1g08769 [Holotrichia oblita]